MDNTITMTREQFYEFAMDNVGEYLPADVGEYKLEFTDCKRTNDEYKGLLIKRVSEPSGCFVRPVANLDMFYEQYDDGRCLVDVLMDIAEMITMPVPESMKSMVDNHWITDYEQCKDKLMIAAYDKDNVTTTVTRDVVDGLVLVARVVVNEDEDGIACATVTDDVLNTWKVDVDKMFDDAFKNSVEKRPVKIEKLSEKLGISMPEEIPEPLIVSSGFLGAAALFYDGVMKTVADRIGGSYYAIPSSVHEFLCIPVTDIEERRVSEMVYNVNRECVDPRDRLSDNAYLYDAETDELRKVV